MNTAHKLPPTRISGVINVTPDSFSGDGLLSSDDYVARAVTQGLQMVRDGAQMLDIGGESSRPGHTPISADEEIRRTVPVIAALHGQTNVPIVIDTIKADVAEAALKAGASIINDITALYHDPRMAACAKHFGAGLILMHNRSANNDIRHDSKIGGQYQGARYDNVVEDVCAAMKMAAENALSHGIARDKIILDPGIGFGKSVEQNLTLIAHMDRFNDLGFPLLMGVSRKSFIGNVLDTTIEERLEGTAACVTACVLKGAAIVRVHDVKFMARLVKMAMALRDA